jgi:peptide deformylase
LYWRIAVTQSFKIVLHPDPVLREISLPVREGELKDEFFQQLLFTCMLYQGVGLSAPQVGILKRVICVTVPSNSGPILLPMVNPEIVKIGRKRVEVPERCLSFPGWEVIAQRSTDIMVTYKRPRPGGQFMGAQASFSNLTAQAIQHEIDHLDGKLLIDPPNRIILKPKEALDASGGNN